MKISQSNSYLVVQHVSDGLEYYITNTTGGFSYYDPVRDKFDLTDINVGDTVKLSGKVQSYEKKNNTGKSYKLTYVKGLPSFR